MINCIIGGAIGGISLVLTIIIVGEIVYWWDNLPHNKRKAEKEHEQYLKDLEEYRKRG